MEFNGIPLHPLVVHAAVVFVPLVALAALAYAPMVRWRRLLRWPMLASAVISAGSVQLAVMSGKDLKRRLGIDTTLLQEHQRWAGRLQVGTWVLLALVLLACWALPLAGRVFWRAGSGGLARVAVPAVTVLLPLLALVEGYLVFRTGDAGARAVWAANRS